METIRAAGLLSHLERALVLRLRLVIASLVLVDVTEIVDEQGNRRVARANRLCRSLEGLLVQSLGLAVAALQQKHRGQVGLDLGHPGIGRWDIFLQGGEHLLEHPGRVAVAAQRLVGAGQVVQRQDVGKIVGAGTLGRSFGFLCLGESGGVIAGCIEILKALLRSRNVDLLRRGRPHHRLCCEHQHTNESGHSAPPSGFHDPLLTFGNRLTLHNGGHAPLEYPFSRKSANRWVCCGRAKRRSRHPGGVWTSTASILRPKARARAWCRTWLQHTTTPAGGNRTSPKVRMQHPSQVGPPPTISA